MGGVGNLDACAASSPVSSAFTVLTAEAASGRRKTYGQYKTNRNRRRRLCDAATLRRWSLCCLARRRRHIRNHVLQPTLPSSTSMQIMSSSLSLRHEGCWSAFRTTVILCESRLLDTWATRTTTPTSTRGSRYTRRTMTQVQHARNNLLFANSY